MQRDVCRFTLLLGEFADGSAPLIHHSWLGSVGWLGSAPCGAWVCRSCYGRNIVSYPFCMCVSIYIYTHLYASISMHRGTCLCLFKIYIYIYIQRSVSAGFTLGF